LAGDGVKIMKMKNCKLGEYEILSATNFFKRHLFLKYQTNEAQKYSSKKLKENISA